MRRRQPELGADLRESVEGARGRVLDLKARIARYAGDTPTHLVHALRDAEAELSRAEQLLAALPDEVATYLSQLSGDEELLGLHLRFAPISGEVVNGPAKPPRDPRFVPPEFVLLRREPQGDPPRMSREPLNELPDALTRFERVVIEAPPGSGKTAVLRKLVIETAMTQAGRHDFRRIPLLLYLGDWPADLDLPAWIAVHLESNHGSCALASHVGGLLRDGVVLLALDALNELPLAESPERLKELGSFLAAVPAGNQVILSSRPWDHVPEQLDYQRIELNPLSSEGTRLLLERSFGAVAGAELLAQLKGTPLGELASVPYFALMLGFVYEELGSIPESKGALISQFIDVLLEREANNPAAGALPRDVFLTVVSELAYEAQRLIGAGSSMPMAWAEEHIPRVVEQEGRLWSIGPSVVVRLAADSNLAEVSRDWRRFRFSHHILFDWLAGRAIGAKTHEVAEAARHWAVPMLRAEMPPAEPVGSWRVSIAPPPATGWEQATILASGVGDDVDDLIARILPHNPLLAARCLTEGAANVSQDTKQAVVQRLCGITMNPSMSVRTRIAAGDLLGELGDPRLREEPIVLAKGSFTMGDDTRDAYGGQCEAHEVATAGFAIARYPVTCGEYEVFIEAGGYDDPSLWSEEGWSWRLRMPVPEIENWGNDAVHRRNSPVVGVSWYEATAFAAWAGGRLPTEAEWERAAAADPISAGRWSFPWGDVFEPWRLNCRDSPEVAGRTTPVGIYSDGVSPCGSFDMCGNVWEWCSSAYAPYPYHYDDGREDTHGGANRVLRGGTFWSRQNFVRCSARFQTHPGYRFDVAGLRLAYNSPAAKQRATVKP